VHPNLDPTLGIGRSRLSHDCIDATAPNKHLSRRLDAASSARIRPLALLPVTLVNNAG